MKKNNKLLIVTPTYLPSYDTGGPVFQIKKLTENLKKRKIIYKVICSTNSLALISRKDANTIYIKTYFGRLYLSFALLIYLIKNIKKYNVVYIVSCYNFFSLFSSYICRLKKINYFISPRGSLMNKSIMIKNTFIKKLWIFFFDRKFILSAKKIIFSSQYEKIETIKVLKIKNYIVIKNFILNDKIKKNKKENYLLYLGRIDKKKNIDIIIHAIKKTNNFFLKIMGNGKESYLRYLKRIVSENNLENRVSFIKADYTKNKNQLFGKASISFLISKVENFGNTILESIINYTPVIISPYTGLSQDIKKNNFGFICNDNIKSLSSLLKKIDTKKIKIPIIRKNKLKKFLNDYKTKVIFDKYINLFKFI